MLREVFAFFALVTLCHSIDLATFTLCKKHKHCEYDERCLMLFPALEERTGICIQERGSVCISRLQPGDAEQCRYYDCHRDFPGESSGPHVCGACLKDKHCVSFGPNKNIMSNTCKLPPADTDASGLCVECSSNKDCLSAKRSSTFCSVQHSWRVDGQVAGAVGVCLQKVDLGEPCVEDRQCRHGVCAQFGPDQGTCVEFEDGHVINMEFTTITPPPDTTTAFPVFETEKTTSGSTKAATDSTEAAQQAAGNLSSEDEDKDTVYPPKKKIPRRRPPTARAGIKQFSPLPYGSYCRENYMCHSNACVLHRCAINKRINKRVRMKTYRGGKGDAQAVGVKEFKTGTHGQCSHDEECQTGYCHRLNYYIQKCEGRRPVGARCARQAACEPGLRCRLSDSVMVREKACTQPFSLGSYFGLTDPKPNAWKLPAPRRGAWPPNTGSAILDRTKLLLGSQG